MKEECLELVETRVDCIVDSVTDSKPVCVPEAENVSGSSLKFEKSKRPPRPILEFFLSIAAVIALSFMSIGLLAYGDYYLFSYANLYVFFLIPALVAASWPIRLAGYINRAAGQKLIKVDPRAIFAAVHPFPLFLVVVTNGLILANYLPWEMGHKLIAITAFASVTMLVLHSIMYIGWQSSFLRRFQSLLKEGDSGDRLASPYLRYSLVLLTIALSGSFLASPLALPILYFTQAVLYKLLVDKLKKMEPEKLAIQIKNSAALTANHQKEEMILPYSSFAEIERWYSQRVKLHSPRKLILVSAIATIAFVLNVPALALFAAAHLFFGTNTVLGGIGGGSGAMALAHAQQNFSFVFMCITLFLFLAGVSAALLAYMRRPRGLAVGESGIRFVYSHLSGKDDQYLAWSDIDSIEIQRPPGKTSTFDDWLIFHKKAAAQPIVSLSSTSTQAIGPALAATKARAPLKIRTGSLPNNDDKEKLLAAIERYAPHANKDARIIEALQRPADQSYTELWLQALSAPPQREKLKPLVAGVTLKNDRYRVLRQLGVGGQGFAYLAQDSTTQEELVLKEFVLPIYVDVTARKQALERFEKEARLLAKLDHPQVVKLAGFFVEDHRAYLVLEHIDGDNLRTIIERRSPLPDSEIRALALRMAEILRYLHGLSPPLVHRDFTPDNLILGKDGKLKLIDFNVAQQIETATTGTVVGKQAYLPPEQFRGQATTASDLYAMGATLYFLASGRDPVPISQSQPSADGLRISEPLDKLISGLTEIEETARTKSAQIVLEIIQSWNQKPGI